MELFLKMRNSTDAQPALDVWFPPSSDLTARILSIYSAHPEGFYSSAPELTPRGTHRLSGGGDDDDDDGDIDWDKVSSPYILAATRCLPLSCTFPSLPFGCD